MHHPTLIAATFHLDREAGPERPARKGRTWLLAHNPARRRVPSRSWVLTTCARAITRMAHEIIERNHGIDRVALVGIQQGGVWLAEALGDAISRIDGSESRRSGRLGRRQPVPRRHRPATGLPRSGQQPELRRHRRDGGARRRRAVHRPHRAGRARRGRRLRTTERGAAGGARRSWPPRAADPPRLRRQEPADQLVTNRSSPASTAC